MVAAQLSTQTLWVDILIPMSYSSQHLKMHKVNSKGYIFLFFVQLRRQQFVAALRWVIVHLLTWKSVDKITKERQLGSHGVYAALSLTSGWLWSHLIPFTWAKYIAWYLCCLWSICYIPFKLLKKDLISFNLASKGDGFFKICSPSHLKKKK